MSYIIPPAPIPGNGPLDVAHVATQFTLMNADEVEADNSRFNNINVELLNSSVIVPGKTLYQMVAYAPTSFATTAATSGVFLNKFPNQPAAIDSVGNTTVSNYKVSLATLPVGAVILDAKLTNNGTLITSSFVPTYSVAVQSWSAVPVGANIFNGATMTSVNALGGVLNKANTNILPLGSAGAVQNGTVVVTAGNQNIGVLVNVANNTAGDLALIINYVL
jgi:hypothetical protein